MVFLEMVLKSVVVNVVLLLTVPRPAVTNVAALMFVSAMGIKLIIAVETLATESALRMTTEPTLVHLSRLIVTILLMLPKFCCCEQLMFMCEYLFIPCAEVTVGYISIFYWKLVLSKRYLPHHLSMLGLDMAMKVWPAQTRYIAVFIRAVVPQQQYSVLEDFVLLILDS